MAYRFPRTYRLSNNIPLERKLFVHSHEEQISRNECIGLAKSPFRAFIIRKYHHQHTNSNTSVRKGSKGSNLSWFFLLFGGGIISASTNREISRTRSMSFLLKSQAKSLAHYRNFKLSQKLITDISN